MWIWKNECWHTPCNILLLRRKFKVFSMLMGVLALLTSPTCLSLSLPYPHPFAVASETFAAPPAHQAVPCLCAFVHAIPSTLPPLPSLLSGKHLLAIGDFPELRHHFLPDAFLKWTSPTIGPQSHLASQHYCTLFSPLLSLEDRDRLLWSSTRYSGGAQ